MQAALNVKSIDVLSVLSGLVTVFVFINDNAYWGVFMAVLPMFICAGVVLRDHALAEKCWRMNRMLVVDSLRETGPRTTNLKG